MPLAGLTLCDCQLHDEYCCYCAAPGRGVWRRVWHWSVYLLEVVPELSLTLGLSRTILLGPHALSYSNARTVYSIQAKHVRGVFECFAFRQAGTDCIGHCQCLDLGVRHTCMLVGLSLTSYNRATLLRTSILLRVTRNFTHLSTRQRAPLWRMSMASLVRFPARYNGFDQLPPRPMVVCVRSNRSSR